MTSSGTQSLSLVPRIKVKTPKILDNLQLQLTPCLSTSHLLLPTQGHELIILTRSLGCVLSQEWIFSPCLHPDNNLHSSQLCL